MPILTIDELLSAPPKQVPSLVGDGLIPALGKVLIVGETESGKSVLAFDISICLALQKPLFGAIKQHARKETPYFPVHRPARVLYIDTELGWRGCYDRMQLFSERYALPALGKLGDAIMIVTQVPGLKLHPLRGEKPGHTSYDRLHAIIADKQPDVVVFDPLIEFHNVDENSSQFHIPVSNLSSLQSEFGFVSIVVHHASGKDFYTQMGTKVRKDSIDKPRGHSSLVGWADTVLVIERSSIEEPRGFIDLQWAKIRQGPRVPNGVCFIDLERMYLQWVTADKGQRGSALSASRKCQFRGEYDKQFPLSESIFFKEIDKGEGLNDLKQTT